MLASVVMIAYHSDDMIAEYEKQLSDQQDFELLVVNNCGTFRPACATTKVINPGGNIGFGRGCNLGAHYATGKVLVFLNPDMAIDLNSLRSLAETCGQAESPMLLGPAIVNHKGMVAKLIEPGRFGLSYSRVECLASVSNVLESSTFVSGACLVIQREFFLDLGGFDEDIFMYGEDLDLSLKARAAGAVVAVDYSIQGSHSGGESSSKGKRPFKRLFRSIGGHYVALRKRKSVLSSSLNAIHLASGKKI